MVVPLPVRQGAIKIQIYFLHQIKTPNNVGESNFHVMTHNAPTESDHDSGKKKSHQMMMMQNVLFMMTITNNSLNKQIHITVCRCELVVL